MTHTIAVHPVPDVGRFELNVPHVVDVVVSAEQAQKRCNSWLLNEVNMCFLANEPEFLIVEGAAVWRIPIMFTASMVGIVDQVGHVDMDVMTGEMMVEDEEIDVWYERCDALVETLPPFEVRTVSAEYLPPTHLQASIGTSIE